MKYFSSDTGNVNVSVSLFENEVLEAHVMVRVKEGAAPFNAQLSDIIEALDETASSLGLSPVYLRLFLSDAANQVPHISIPFNVPLSLIQQQPLDGSRVALWAILKPNVTQEEIAPGVWRGSDGMVRTAGMAFTSCAQRPDGSFTDDSRLETIDYLETLDSILKKEDGSLERNCLRTWFMVRDIDVNYAGVVTGRNEVFERKGLTSSTHFIASTGINGGNAEPCRTVTFSAFADLNVTPDKITYLHAPAHLNRTSDYGVAFERGVAVDYPECRQLYISGTASINNRGEIVHPGDIVGQTHRMLENIGSLLAEGGAGWNDVAHFIVYLRDMADYPLVDGIFAERHPDVPTVFLLAPVCRPGWLVETECMAILPSVSQSPSF